MKTKWRKITAIFMALALAISMVPTVVFAEGETVLAQWSFVSGELTSTATLPQYAKEEGVFPDSSFSHYAKTDVNYTGSLLSVYTNGWEVGGYWEIETSSLGYENLQIDYQAWGSGTGPKNFTLQYSTDGISFEEAESYYLTVTQKTAYGFALPEGASDAENLVLRFVVADDVSINGATFAGTGTSRMAEIKITGAPIGEEETRVATPVAKPAGGNVGSGEVVTFTTATEGADLLYNLDGGDDWTAVPDGGLPITGAPGSVVEVWVKAVKDDLEDSNILELAYTIVDLSEPLNIKEVLGEADGSTVTAVGQLVYRYGNYDGANTAILEAVIDGRTYALQVYDALSDYAIGDIIEITGKKTTYGGVPQVQDIAAHDLVTAASETSLIKPAEFEGFDALLAEKEERLSQVVLIKNVTLGAYNDNGATTLTDSQGETMPIYRAATYPDGVAADDVVDVLAVLSKYNTTDQLRVGSPAHNGGWNTYIGEGDPGPVDPDDPIPDETFPAGALNINEAIATADTTTGVIVVGQLVYRFGNYNGMNSAILQDIIGGELVALQLYNSLDDYEIGDVLKITGQKTTYGGVPQMQGITGTELVSAAKDVPLIAPTEYQGFDALRAEKAERLSQVVLVKNVILGTYSDSASTTLTDSQGKTMPIYRAATYPDGVEAGEIVDVLAVLSKYNTTDQLRVGTPGANGNRAVYSVTNDTKPPVITLPTGWPGAKAGEDYTVSVEVADNKGVAAVTVTYSTGNEPVTEAMELVAATGKYEYTIPGARLEDAAALRFTVKAVDVSGLETETEEQTVVIADVPLLAGVQPERGSATFGNKRPVIAVTLENQGESPTVTLTLSLSDGTPVLQNAAMTGAGNVYSYASYAADLADGKYKAEVTILRRDGVSVTYDWNFTVGEYQFSAYFGQLHSHTGQYSDGTGTLAQALDYIRDTASKDNVDFVAFTDHSNYFDSSGSGANPPEALGDLSKATAASREKWETYTGDMRAFNAAGYDMLAIPGFEMTWSGGPGHMNTFNTEGIVSRNNSSLNNKTDDAGMKAYYELLKQNPESISQFNHPGTTFGTFANFSYWDPAIDNVVTLIEVGNGEGAGVGSGYFPSYEYYVQALDKGWHVAPTNNQDNHKGKWGNSNTMRSVIITEDFSEQGMLEGMRKMTMYSTEDKNLQIMYTVNGSIMGSTISQKPDVIRVQAEIDDPDGEAVGLVEIVVNGGRVVHQQTIADSTASLDFELPADYSYYFLRVVQPDTDIAVTAPVWVGDVVKSGITEINTDTVMPVKDESMTFNTLLYNFEPYEMAIDSIEYSITHLGAEKVIHTESDVAPIPANTSEKVFTLQYTPDLLGPVTLTVKVAATLNGVAYDYESSLAFEVLDPDSVVPIAIDAGHNNFYVSGNYANSDAAFIEMCNRSGVRVTRLQKGELTYDNIKDMKLLVLTVPFKSFGTSVADSLYSAAEIAAIQQYAAAGGNLLITSKSDRGDPSAANEKASAITNEILEAVGAKARVAQAIVVDPVRKANEAFRITLGGESGADKLCFNYGAMATDVWAATFLRDVEATTNNLFSAYNSAPILANGATPIVTGFPETTFGTGFNSLVSNQVPAGGAPHITEPGETHLIVAEALSGGGFLITSGVTFFSTFEVKPDLDYAGQLQNSNYQIVQNILDQIKPDATVTDIADVQAAAEGLKFTVEGIATSNASGYDRDTAFFDCIYLQDATAGINVFPVDGNIRAGQTLRITGYTSSYNGERQLNASLVEVVDETVKPLPEPLVISAEEADTGAYLGSLVSLSGVVTEIEFKEGLPESIHVSDGSNVARVFIDGYITNEKTIANLAVGCEITAVGLSSHDTEGHRIRIRDRDDISCKAGVQMATVSFDLNGGTSGAIEPIEVEVNGTITFPTPPTRTSGTHFYTFKGWTLTRDGSVFFTQSTPVTKDITLYAKWDAVEKIVVTGTEGKNKQGNVFFNIKSANGKGYSVYLSENGENGAYRLYSNVNYNAKGVHIKGLTNGKTYHVYIEYTENGRVTYRSEKVAVTAGK